MNRINKLQGRRLAAVLVIMIIIFMLGTAKAYGEEEKDTARITNLQTEIKAEDNFTFNVTQTIDVNFSTLHHGIYIFVPFKIGESRITDVSTNGPGNADINTFKLENGQPFVTMKLGDKDKYLDGDQSWTVKYKIIGVDDGSSKADYLSLAVVAPFWDMPIDNAETVVTMPKKTDWSKLETFTGPYGSTINMLDDEHFQLSTTDRTLTVKAKDLPARYGASIRTLLPNGYWKNPMSQRAIPLKVLLSFALVLAAVVLIAWLVRRNRKPVEVVEFYPPDDMTPAEIGYLIDGAVDKKDMVSLFFYMADKGYISIVKTGKDSYEMKKLKDIDDEEPAYVRKLYDAMFDGSDVFIPEKPPEYFSDGFMSAVINLTYMKNYQNKIYDFKINVLRFIVTIGIIATIPLNSIRLGVVEYSAMNFAAIIITILAGIGVSSYTSKLVFKKLSMTVREYRKTVGMLFVMFAVIVMMEGYLASVAFHQPVIGAISGGVLALSFMAAAYIKRWGKDMKALAGRIIGFRNYIYTAEADKLKVMVEEDPDYYYRILPYAYVFGLYTLWSKKFEDIPIVQSPSYAGMDFADATSMVYMMNSVTRHTSSYVTSRIADNLSGAAGSYGGEGGGGGFSGGGFSGGGFSGGGFGGGGGGAW